MGHPGALAVEWRVPSENIGLCKEGGDCGEAGAFIVTEQIVV